ncbi:alginate export family protein [Stenotrophomonas pavanii]|uniref:alginate export family protein n=1 Tax=Stenotrophomonas pavanii TaxID=487698 RepID=UPI00066C809C|nr:alginate export family protein [Stenotrophomonas maltophilia]MBN5059260.1 alginate export family protein [Stenotrophomonas maltophilia]MBN5065882.1 alginate export family protein [Stenotrophomonas maltophilia]
MLVLRVLSLALLAAPSLVQACEGGHCTDVGGGQLQWDASLRLRGMYYDPARFGIGGNEDGYGLLRALASTTYVEDNWRARLQLGVHAENGKAGGPGRTDRGALDVQQAYWRWQRGGFHLQLGRQEAGYGSSRLLSVRDGPNIRLAFDGARAGWKGRLGTLDLIALRPLENRPGAFDDRGERGAHLWGAYATTARGRGLGQWDLYLLDYRREGARFAAGSGTERRQTLGARWFGQAGALDWNTELVAQGGELQTVAGTLDVRAWTLATDTGWRWIERPLQPRLGLKADIASGDGNLRDGRVGTFNALFPKSAYFSEASLLAPANLMDVQPTLTLRLRDAVTTELGVQMAWKHRRADAVYTTPAPLLALPGSAGGARRIGTQYKSETRWQASEHWQWQLQLAWVDAGPALKQAGGQDTLFASIVGAWQW